MLLGTHTKLEDLIALRLPATQMTLNKLWRTTTQQAGAQAFKLRARGMEFAEVRAYTPGDDVRTIDWRVTARTGKMHTKVFIEEKEQQALMLLDQSPTMFFGSRKRLKSVAAAEMAALILWTALQHGHKTGGVLLGKERMLNISPKNSRTNTLQFLRHIDDYNQSLKSPYSGENQPSLVDGLEKMQRLSHAGALLFVISDFQAAQNQFKQLQQRFSQLRKKHTIVCMMIFDPLETNLPKQGLYGMTDGKRNQSIDTAYAQTRADYEDGFKQKRAAVIDLCNLYRMHYLPISTAEDTASALTHWLPRRQRLALS